MAASGRWQQAVLKTLGRDPFSDWRDSTSAGFVAGPGATPVAAVLPMPSPQPSAIADTPTAQSVADVSSLAQSVADVSLSQSIADMEDLVRALATSLGSANCATAAGRRSDDPEGGASPASHVRAVAEVATIDRLLGEVTEAADIAAAAATAAMPPAPSGDAQRTASAAAADTGGEGTLALLRVRCAPPPRVGSIPTRAIAADRRSALRPSPLSPALPPHVILADLTACCCCSAALLLCCSAALRLPFRSGAARGARRGDAEPCARAVSRPARGLPHAPRLGVHRRHRKR